MIAKKSSTYSKIFVITVAAAILFIIGLYAYLKHENNERIAFIQQNYGVTRGVIRIKHTFKNKMTIIYKVDEETYSQSVNLPSEASDQLVAGDSITLKYAKADPDIMITEFQEGY